MRTIRGVFAILAAGALAGLSCREPMRPPSTGGIALRVAPAPEGVAVLDAGRVVLGGPTDTTVSAVPGQQVTIGGLRPGTYSVALEGLVGNEVAYFGQTSGVTVQAGRDTPASVDFPPFQPQAPVFPDTFWIGKQVTVGILDVPNADHYLVEWSLDPTFASNPPSQLANTPSVQISVATYDVYFVRLRAVDPLGTTGVPGTATRIRVVQAGPEKQLAFTTQPSLVPAGFPILPAVTVTVQDSLGNTVTGYSGDITLAITAQTGTPGTVLHGTTIQTVTAGAAAFPDVSIDSAGVGYTLTATASGLSNATSAAFNVVPRLVFITEPQTTLARGIIPPIQVVAQDGGDHTVTGFTDAIRIAISSGSGTLGATLSGTVQQPADTGVVTFSDLSIDALGTDYTLTITAATGDSYGGADPAQSLAFDVTLQYVFATQPTGTGNYMDLTPAVQVAAHNGLGATEQTFQGDITVALDPGSGTLDASLLGTTTVTAVTGVATFPGLKIDLPGAGYRLQALGDPNAGLLGGLSDTFAIACATDCWTGSAPMPTPRSGLGVGVANGILYAIGGIGATAYDTVEAYDPANDSWTPRASMSIDRQQPGVGVVNGIVYVVGGFSFSALDTVEAYDPATNTWSFKAPMPTARYGLGVGVVNGILYAVGGFDGSNVSAALEAYDPVANTWSTKAPLPTPRSLLGVGVINGTLYAVGGGTSMGTSLVLEAYDPVSNTWSPRAPMPVAQSYFAVGVLNGLLYAVGGSDARVQVYDPQTDSWASRASLPARRELPGIGVVNGLLYVVGGNDGLNDVGDVWAYHP